MLQHLNEKNRDLLISISTGGSCIAMSRDQPVRFGGAGGRCGLGRIATLQRPQLQTTRTSGAAARSAEALAFAEFPEDENIIDESSAHSRQTRCGMASTFGSP